MRLLKSRRADITWKEILAAAIVGIVLLGVLSWVFGPTGKAVGTITKPFLGCNGTSILGFGEEKRWDFCACRYKYHICPTGDDCGWEQGECEKCPPDGVDCSSEEKFSAALKAAKGGTCCRSCKTHWKFKS